LVLSGCEEPACCSFVGAAVDAFLQVGFKGYGAGFVVGFEGVVCPCSIAEVKVAFVVAP
jgi:hypothetical protein